MDLRMPEVLYTKPHSAPVGQTRTTVIQRAIAAHLEQRRALIDGATDLGAVTLIVRMHAGTCTIKSISITEERIARRT